MRYPLGPVTLLMSMSVVAQPIVNEPLIGNHSLRYTVGYQNQCTHTTSTNNAENSKAQRGTTRTSTRTWSKGGKDSLSYEVRMDGNYLTISFELTEQGSVAQQKPTVETDLKVMPESIEMMASMFGNVVQDGLGGRTYSSNQKNPFKANICTFLGGTHTGAHTGFVQAAGFINIQGYRALLMKSTIDYSCTIQRSQIQLQGNGWDAYDTISGLPIQTYFKANVFKDGNRVGEYEQTSQCTILPTMPVSNIGTPPSNREIQLKEAKDLYEKGLINKEVYDQAVGRIMGIK